MTVALNDDLAAEVKSMFAGQWSVHEGLTVPDESNVTFGNDGVSIEATVLYADLSDSTDLVDRYVPTFAAEIYKSFLRCASKIIRDRGGTITSFDGDRVMAVYVGEGKEAKACWTALYINRAMIEIVRPALAQQYPDDQYVPRHTVGIDSSSILVVKDGVRGDNDLLWIGRAANYAAKMCALDHAWSTRITRPVLDAITGPLITDVDGGLIWSAETWTEMKGLEIYRTGHKAVDL